MNHIKKILFIIVISFSTSCTKDYVNTIGDFDMQFLAGTTAIPSSFKPNIEGIYKLNSGSSRFGSNFVFKWVGDILCVFSDKSGIYINFKVGFNPIDSSLKFSGIYRTPMLESNSEQLLWTVSKEDGVKQLFLNDPKSIVFKGENKSSNGVTLTNISYVRPFSDKVKNSEFTILAHRCGGRNADNVPYAENSLNLVKYAERMGATGVELDIHLTYDKVPVIYHDDEINIRLTQKSPLNGKIEDYDYDFLKNNIKLLDGQPIPTLEEMLNTIIDSTTLSVVWLDLKQGDDIFRNMHPVIVRAYNKIKQKNRKLDVYFGIPNDDIKTAVLNLQKSTDLPTLCEISLDDAIALKSKVYAPRWTLGTMNDVTSIAKANGIKTFTWTLDNQAAIKTFLSEGAFDGILTNFPSILAYEFYSQE